jgi:hypothetical protein
LKSPLRVVSRHALPRIRAIAAALLTIVVLSGIVPFSVLSASHSCSMPCCAGSEGGCETGACKGALFKNPKKSEDKEELCGAEAHASKKKSHAVAPAAASMSEDHCGSQKEEAAPEKAEAAQPASSSGETLQSFVYASALGAPCSKDCCAVVTPSAQSRRGRDSTLASLSSAGGPPGFISLSLFCLNLQPIASAHLKRLRGRAPPGTPLN